MSPKYFIVTTTKFADQCMHFQTYGASQSNWLCNVNMGDILFLSQFSYKSQDVFGPFRVTRSLYYDKTNIYPNHKYYFRIQFEPIREINLVEETDLYLQGVRSGSTDLYFRIINLLQQNKHLHCICLTEQEGEAIFNAFNELNSIYRAVTSIKKLPPAPVCDVDRPYLWNKNKLDRRECFSTESDLESYLMMSLQDSESSEYRNIDLLLNVFNRNDIRSSEAYNQFIFGNAYPSDIAILNDDNVNVFELKKDALSNSLLPRIEKEITKPLCYSALSNRIHDGKSRNFNYYLVCLQCKDNKQYFGKISETYRNLCKRVDKTRNNTLTCVEYVVKNGKIILESVAL